jgi:hypothetical protein
MSINDVYPPVLSRSLILDNKKTEAISTLFDLDSKTIKRMFQNVECFTLFRVKKLPRLDSAKSRRKNARKKVPQPIPGPGSTKIKYMCNGLGCKEFRYLTNGEAARKDYLYYCPSCAQIFRNIK